MENNLLKYALMYWDMGISIFPLRHGTKLPLSEELPLCKEGEFSVRSWKPFQDTQMSREKVIDIWTRNPRANIAGVMGKISNVACVDQDLLKKDGMPVYPIRRGDITGCPPTASATTWSGGKHCIYRYVNDIPTKHGFREMVDIQSNGSYIVLAPSVISGKQYQWDTDWLEAWPTLPPFPVEILKDQVTESIPKFDLRQYVGVNEGNRNDRMHRLSCSLYVRGYSDDDVAATAYEINRTYNPPLANRELETILLSARKFVATSNKKKALEASKSSISHALVTCFANIRPEPIQWLWPGRFALGKLTLLAGDPGLGKSLITVDMAATVSRGKAWPVDGLLAPLGDVVFLSAEDDPADTIRPRLDAAGADCNRVHILEAVHDEQQQGESKRRIFNLSRDCLVLERLITSLPKCKLVIIDPVSAYLGGTDSHNNADIRGLLAPLADIASRFNVAMVIVSHLNKSDQGKAIYRVMGSLAFSAAARAAFIVMKDKDNEERRLFLPIKNNLGKDRDGYAYTVTESENNAPRLAWEPELVSNIADEAIAEAESQEDHTETEWAEMFLEDLLSRGPMLVQDVNKEARIAGIKDKPLRRARENLGVLPKKVAYSQGWKWVLPGHEDAQSTEDALIKEVGTFEEKGILEVNKTTEDAQPEEAGMLVSISLLPTKVQ